MSLSAMSSFIVSFRDTKTVGLAQQVTDCEWAAEVDHGGGQAWSGRVAIAAGQTDEIALADIFEHSGVVRALAVKSISGDLSVSWAGSTAVLAAGSASCWSSDGGLAAPSITLSNGSTAQAVADIVIVCAPGV